MASIPIELRTAVSPPDHLNSPPPVGERTPAPDASFEAHLRSQTPRDDATDPGNEEPSHEPSVSDQGTTSAAEEAPQNQNDDEAEQSSRETKDNPAAESEEATDSAGDDDAVLLDEREQLLIEAVEQKQPTAAADQQLPAAETVIDDGDQASGNTPLEKASDRALTAGTEQVTGNLTESEETSQSGRSGAKAVESALHDTPSDDGVPAPSAGGQEDGHLSRKASHGVTPATAKSPGTIRLQPEQAATISQEGLPMPADFESGERPESRPDRPAEAVTASRASGDESAAPSRDTQPPPTRLAEQLLPKTATKAADAAPQLNSAQQTRFVDRVARAFQAAESRGGTLRIRLHPPELGSLKIEMRVQDGAITARLEAETGSARSLLLDNLPVLRERLAEQGVRIEEFEVGLQQHHSGQAQGEPGNDSRDSSSQDSSGNASPSGTREDGEPGAANRLTGSSGDRQLDVII